MIAILVRYWYLAAIAALVALLGIQSARISALKSEHAEYIAESQKAARLAVEQAFQEQSRRQQAYDEEAEHARAEKAELEASVAKLADTADGLRGDIAAFQRRANSQPKPAIGSKGESGPSPADLLAGLYLGSVETNKQLASYATELRRAGSACERAADNAR